MRSGLLVLTLAACTAPAHPVRPSVVDDALDHFLAFEPAGAVHVGLHTYDGKLPDRSPAGIATELTTLRADLARLTRDTPGGSSDVESATLEQALRGRIFELAELDVLHTDPTSYSDAVDPSPYVVHAYAPAATRARALRTMCENLPVLLAQARVNLDRPLPRPMLAIAIGQMSGFAEFVAKDARRELASVPDLGPALDACARTYNDHVAWLKQQQARATNEYALGEKKLLGMLAETQGITVDLATLERVVEEDFARNRAAMEAAAHDLDPSRPVADVIATLPRPAADQVIAVGQAQADQLRDFIIAHDLVSLPGANVAVVREAPPYERWNFAFLDPPGPFESAAMPAYYYIAPPDPSWPADEQRAYITPTAQLLYTTAHEVYPGHFVHFEHLRRNRSRVLRAIGMYTTMEGWAHYTEEMMYDAGAGDHAAEAHVGQLASALLRDGRFVAALGLHARGMTVEHAEQMFRTQAFADPGTAHQQAVRGTFDPMYLSYTLGKLAIRKLRDDYLARFPGKTLRDFHDAFLANGGAPLPAIRKALLGSADGLL